MRVVVTALAAYASALLGFVVVVAVLASKDRGEAAMRVLKYLAWLGVAASAAKFGVLHLP